MEGGINDWCLFSLAYQFKEIKTKLRKVTLTIIRFAQTIDITLFVPGYEVVIDVGYGNSKNYTEHSKRVKRVYFYFAKSN